MKNRCSAGAIWGKLSGVFLDQFHISQLLLAGHGKQVMWKTDVQRGRSGGNCLVYFLTNFISASSSWLATATKSCEKQMFSGGDLVEIVWCIFWSISYQPAPLGWPRQPSYLKNRFSAGAIWGKLSGVFFDQFHISRLLLASHGNQVMWKTDVQRGRSGGNCLVYFLINFISASSSWGDLGEIVWCIFWSISYQPAPFG